MPRYNFNLGFPLSKGLKLKLIIGVCVGVYAYMDMHSCVYAIQLKNIKMRSIILARFVQGVKQRDKSSLIPRG